ncbi:MAG: iron-sulfur cluster repair di-iron protein [Sphingobacteriales bacterium]|nr:MAG: iron-sulfur cluster repair di-iron protein [Sphingobacteriales bacterium]
METSVIKQRTIGEIVAENYHAATVFEKHQIDYCCGGKKTLNMVCQERGLDPVKLQKEIEETNLPSEMPPSQNSSKWSLALLVNYIVEAHHQYIKESIPVLLKNLDKIASVHGKNHPELFIIHEIFKTLSVELSEHLHKEETVLFPYIIQLVKAETEHTKPELPVFNTIQNPLRMLETEHDVAGNLMFNIRELSNRYFPPADACTTYKVTLLKLQEFETDLHHHVHLENNILFPKAVKLEESLRANP